MALHPRLCRFFTAAWIVCWLVCVLLLGMFDRLEWALTLAAVGIAVYGPRSASGWLRRPQEAFGRLARRKGLAVLAVAGFVLVVRAALLPVLPVPFPIVHDEFSYLLAADTFASGRLTNPSHPMWVHFETFHVLPQPTRASKYPPAQGLLLALGQKLFGHPWFGVLLSAALMSAAICWMLQQWLPPGWALLGGFLVAVRFGVTSYWVNSYWGGAVAAAAGALVWGAAPGFLNGKRLRHGLLLGLGAVILANSRPFEGFLICLPLAGVAVVRFVRSAWSARNRWLRAAALPAVGMLLAGGAATCYYHWRVTGDPWKMPRQVYAERYASTGYFLGGELASERKYNHDVLRRYFVDHAQGVHKGLRSAWLFALVRAMQTLLNLSFYLGPALALPLAALPWIVGDRRLGAVLITLLLFVVLTNSQINPQPHYLAPALGLLTLVLLQSMRHLRHWREGERKIGETLVRLAPAVCVVMLASCAVQGASADPATQGPIEKRTRCLTTSQYHPLRERSQIEARLSRGNGRHLVFVRYSPKHIVFEEWVYNRADIDNAQVVWARDMGRARNCKLLRYFKDRRAWLIEPDNDPARLRPYEPGKAAAAGM